MNLLILLSALVAVSGQNLRTSYENTPVTSSCSVIAQCTSNGVAGNCVSKSSGCCRGTLNPANLCPGNDDVQCCYNAPCQTTHGAGTCMQTSLCHSKGGTPDSGNYCDGPADLQCCVNGGPGPTPSGKISRDEVIARAQDWVNRRIPYSQSAYTDGYRQDCSGMVSMAWKSSTAGGGHCTADMQDICHRISRSELQKGDVLLYPGDHVLMFDYWVDSDHFMEYAEHDYGQVASHDQTSYSYWANQGFFPCRYNDIA